MFLELLLSTHFTIQNLIRKGGLFRTPHFYFFLRFCKDYVNTVVIFMDKLGYHWKIHKTLLKSYFK